MKIKREFELVNGIWVDKNSSTPVVIPPVIIPRPEDGSKLIITHYPNIVLPNLK